MKMDMQLLADVLRDCGCEWVIDEIAKKDVVASQILDVLIMEDDNSWVENT